MLKYLECLFYLSSVGCVVILVQNRKFLRMEDHISLSRSLKNVQGHKHNFIKTIVRKECVNYCVSNIHLTY